MNDLRKQIRSAHHRMILQQFISITLWSACGALAVAGIGISIRKIWPITTDENIWTVGWIVGSLGVGLLVAAIMTYVQRKNALDAAIEIDRRFGLKERVSSCLSMNEDQQNTEAGRALVDDAVRRVNQVDVRQEFRVSPGRWAWLPLSMAAVVFGLTFLTDATPDPASKANAAAIASRKRIQNSTTELKKKIEQKRKKALEQGLEDAGSLFKKLEKGMDSIANKNNVDRKKAMLKLNDIAKDIKKRQEKLGSRDEMRQQLKPLKDLKQGPAEQMSKALSESDFKTAINELSKMQEQLRNGEMSKTDRDKLKQQLDQMKQTLQQMAENHESKKQQLEDEIKKQIAQGDRKAAGELQRKLDKMKQQDEQTKKMANMAKQLAECSSCMKEGDSKGAAEQMAQMSESLQQMADEMEEMEMLEESLDQIAQAKDSMDCNSCNGAGCSTCESVGMGTNGSGMNEGGRGLGEGRGQGDRPEEETQSGFYDSQVRAKAGRGQAVATGTASGPNKSGEALESIKTEIESTKRSDDDPLTGQRLPKPQRELAREYFDAIREGK
ncbi:MAG: hypothetical protein GY768_22405 [Planctomycetaceae bacterium]|nr:hypothetical protein [Planctomycetaceae bacterium]